MVLTALELSFGLWENLCYDFEMMEIQPQYLFDY
jgi:hypothetical protein